MVRSGRTAGTGTRGILRSSLFGVDEIGNLKVQGQVRFIILRITGILCTLSVRAAIHTCAVSQSYVCIFGEELRQALRNRRSGPGPFELMSPPG